MNGRAYSEGDLSMMINAARQYIQAPDVQREIISKCHQEIGLIMTGSPPHQRAAINLTNLESKAILDAVRSWHLDNDKIQSTCLGEVRENKEHIQEVKLCLNQARP